jgi:hypothetical protein
VATAFQLNLPLDIPWKRICVTQDMLDRVVCDETLPPKWQSSLAVYKYTPEEDYQFYPDYDISYLKVTATITGYQALEDEIQGQINWNGVNTTTVEGASELLKSYFPCTGAIVQVVVGPHGRNPDLSTNIPSFSTLSRRSASSTRWRRTPRNASPARRRRCS